MPQQRRRPPWATGRGDNRRKDKAGQRASESRVKGRRMASSRPTVSTMTAHSLPVALHASATLRSDCLWYATGPHVRSTRTAVHPALSSSTSVATSRQGGPSVTQTAQRRVRRWRGATQAATDSRALLVHIGESFT